MTSTARIPAIEITGVYGSLIKTMSRKMLGQVPDSIGVMWHHRPALMALSGFGRKSQKWDRADPNLKTFAHMAVSTGPGASVLA